MWVFKFWQRWCVDNGSCALAKIEIIAISQGSCAPLSCEDSFDEWIQSNQSSPIIRQVLTSLTICAYGHMAQWRHVQHHFVQSKLPSSYGGGDQRVQLFKPAGGDMMMMMMMMMKGVGIRSSCQTRGCVWQRIGCHPSCFRIWADDYSARKRKSNTLEESSATSLLGW